MTPNAPYLIVSFDLDPQFPDAAHEMARISSEFPIVGTLLPAGVTNVHIIEVAPSAPRKAFVSVVMYLRERDNALQNQLRWIVQLCRTPYVSIG